MINFASSFTVVKAQHGLGSTRLWLSPRPLILRMSPTLGLYPTHKQQANFFLGISVAIVIWNLCQVSKIFCSITDFPRWKVGTAGFSFQALLFPALKILVKRSSTTLLFPCTSIAVLALLYWQYRTRIQIWEWARKGGKGHAFNLATWTIKKKTDQNHCPEGWPTRSFWVSQSIVTSPHLKIGKVLENCLL
jgi:hypothetical protein